MKSASWRRREIEQTHLWSPQDLPFENSYKLFKKISPAVPTNVISNLRPNLFRYNGYRRRHLSQGMERFGARLQGIGGENRRHRRGVFRFHLGAPQVSCHSYLMYDKQGWNDTQVGIWTQHRTRLRSHPVSSFVIRESCQSAWRKENENKLPFWWFRKHHVILCDLDDKSITREWLVLFFFNNRSD